MEYGSLVISLLALIVSVYSVYENRRNNRIGQTPTLVGHETESPNAYSFSVHNKGNGPALLERVEYFKNSQHIENMSFKEAVHRALTQKGIRFKSTITQLPQKGVIAAGEEVLLGRIVFPEEDVQRFQELEDTFAIRITYRSIHGKKKVWSSDDRLQTI